MKEFAWVLIDPEGDVYDAMPDNMPADLSDAWRIFDERLDFQSVAEMQEIGYRVLRVKMTEVGP